MEIENSVAIITGGASGLGEATVRSLHSKKCKVCIFDTNSKKGIAIAEELGKNVAFFKVDVCNTHNVQVAISEVIQKFQKITININCAGIAIAEKTLNKEGPHDLESFRKVIEINLLGTFNIIRLCANEMAKNPLGLNSERGVIINTASVAGMEGQKGQVAYAASKGGVASMTLPIARDLARDSIRCCCIAPGLFLTPMFEGLGEEVCSGLAKDVVFPKRLGTPQEYALFASQIIENTYVNGSIFRLDGGIRLA